LLRLSLLEKDYIKKYYPLNGLKYCANHLGRSESTIRNFCYVNSIKRDKKIYLFNLRNRLIQYNKNNSKKLVLARCGKVISDYYVQLKEMYLSGFTQKQIAKKLGFSVNTVSRAIFSLNLRKVAWKNKEISFLKKHYYDSSMNNIILNLNNKSTAAIIHKAKRLGLTRNKKYQFAGIIKNNLYNNPMKNEETKKKVSKKLKLFFYKHPKKMTNYKLRRNKKTDIEKIMYDFLLSIGFEEGKDFHYNQYFKTKASYKFPDFCFPDKKLIIECDGSYWHQDKQKDDERDLSFKERGYNTYYFDDNLIKGGGFKCQVMALLKV